LPYDRALLTPQLPLAKVPQCFSPLVFLRTPDRAAFCTA
jgi:hypothetical protein